MPLASMSTRVPWATKKRADESQGGLGRTEATPVIGLDGAVAASVEDIKTPDNAQATIRRKNATRRP